MIEPFGFSQLWLLKKLEKRGTAFGLQNVLTRPTSPFWRAVSSYVSVHEPGVHTYFAQADTETGYIWGIAQTRESSYRPEAEIIYIAPSLSSDSETRKLWGQLLSRVCKQAGEQGIQRVFAGVYWDTEEMDALQEEGFITYTREEILRLHEISSARRISSLNRVRRLEDGDENRLIELYMAVTPRRVQWAEGQNVPLSWSTITTRGALRGEEAYVFEEKEGKTISALLHILPGKAGHWLEVVVAPDSTVDVDDLLGFGLERISGWTMRPVYAAVREYQAGVLPALYAKGFESYTRQAVMVKNTAVWVKDPLQTRIPGVEKRVGSSTPTITLTNGEAISDSVAQPIKNLR